MDIFVPNVYEFKALFDCACMEHITYHKDNADETYKVISFMYNKNVKTARWDDLDLIAENKELYNILNTYLNNNEVEFALDGSIMAYYLNNVPIIGKLIVYCMYKEIDFKTKDFDIQLRAFCINISCILKKMQDLSKDLSNLSVIEIACNCTDIKEGFERRITKKIYKNVDSLTINMALAQFKQFAIKNINLNKDGYESLSIEGLIGKHMEYFFQSYVKNSEEFLRYLPDEKTIVDEDGHTLYESIEDSHFFVIEDMPISELLNLCVSVDNILFKGASAGPNVGSILEWMFFKFESERFKNITNYIDNSKLDSVDKDIYLYLIKNSIENHKYIESRITKSFEFLDLMYEKYKTEKNKNVYEFYQDIISSTNSFNIESIQFAYLVPHEDYVDTRYLKSLNLSVDAMIETDNIDSGFGAYHKVSETGNVKGKSYLYLSDNIINHINKNKDLIVSSGLEIENHDYYIILDSGIEKINNLFKVFSILKEANNKLKKNKKNLSFLPIADVKNKKQFKPGMQLSSILNESLNLDYISNYFYNLDMKLGLSNTEALERNLGVNTKFFEKFSEVNVTRINKGLKDSSFNNFSDSENIEIKNSKVSAKFEITCRDMVHYILTIAWSLIFPDAFDKDGSWKDIKINNINGEPLDKYFAYLSDFLATTNPLNNKKLFGLLLLLYQDIGIAGKAMDKFSVCVIQLIDEFLYDIYNESGFVFKGSNNKPIHCPELLNTKNNPNSRKYGNASLHEVIANDFKIVYPDIIPEDRDIKFISNNISVYNIFNAIYYGKDYILKLAEKRIDAYVQVFNTDTARLMRVSKMNVMTNTFHKFIFTSDDYRFLTDTVGNASAKFSGTFMDIIKNYSVDSLDKSQIPTVKHLISDSISGKHTGLSYYINDVCKLQNEDSEAGSSYVVTNYPSSNNIYKYFSSGLLANTLGSTDYYETDTIKFNDTKSCNVYTYKRYPLIAKNSDDKLFFDLLNKNTNRIGDSSNTFDIKSYFITKMKKCKQMQEKVSAAYGYVDDTPRHAMYSSWSPSSIHFNLANSSGVNSSNWIRTLVEQKIQNSPNFAKRFVVGSHDLLSVYKTLYLIINMFTSEDNKMYVNSKCEDIYSFWNIKLQMLYFEKSAQSKVDLANTISSAKNRVNSRFKSGGKYVFAYSEQEAIANLNPKVTLRGLTLLDIGAAWNKEISKDWGIDLIEYSDKVYLTDKRKSDFISSQIQAIYETTNKLQLQILSENEIIKEAQIKVKNNIYFSTSYSKVDISDLSKAYDCALDYVRSPEFNKILSLFAFSANNYYSSCIQKRINKDGFLLRKNYAEDSINWLQYGRIGSNSSHTFIFYYKGKIKVIANAYNETKVSVQLIEEEDLKSLNEQ